MHQVAGKRIVHTYLDSVVCLYGFAVRQSSTTSSLFIYLDEDEDHILTSSDEELSLAMSSSHENLFRVFVLLFQQDHPQGKVKEEVCCCFFLSRDILGGNGGC